jgi:enamine deaminase RidA (YjgF/YER057c/UK114 family)
MASTTSRRQSINLPHMAHGAPIPMGCKVGNIVMSSGIGGAGADGQMPSDPDTQAIQMFDNIRQFMEQAGGSVEDIVHVRILMKDRGQRESINKPWMEMFPDEHSRPARHALETNLGGQFIFQAEIVAVLNS